MMASRLRAIALIILLLCAAGLRTPAQARVTFETSNNVILIPVSINGSEPMPFILDTGASGSVIGERAAKELGLSLKTGGATTTQGGSVASTAVEPVSLGFGTIKISARLTAISLEGLEAGFGTRIDGILGYEAFRRYVVDIDHASRVVTFREPNSFRYLGRGSAVPISLIDKTPFVRVLVRADGGRRYPATLLFDIGNASTMNLYPDFVKRHGLFADKTATLKITFGALIPGLVGRVGRVREMRLGRWPIPEVFVTLPAEANGDAYKDGLIGGEIIRRFHVIVDYSRHRIILEPNEKAIQEPFRFDASGMSLAATGVRLDSVKVRSIIQDSPAAEAALQRDDVITHIDGTRVSEKKLEEIRRSLRVEGRTFRLTIDRKGKTEQITLVTRRMI